MPHEGPLAPAPSRRTMHRLKLRTEHIALGLCLLAVVAAYAVGRQVYEHIPHLEDELAYWWQAQIQARGKLKIPSPPEPQSFLVPFVVDHRGYRFAKYPPGWPMLLALGLRLGVFWWVNPLLAGLSLWLLYRLGSRLWNPKTGLAAVLLAMTSPWFWMLAGSLLPHMATLVYTGVLLLFWLALVDREAPRPLFWWGFVFGAMALVWTRPWTGLGVLLPFGVLALWRWRQGRLSTGMLLGFAGAALFTAGSFALWQWYVTGSPWQNPYTLWWPYDRPGFGPGRGVLPQGHSLRQAWINTRFSLWVGAADLLGWFRVSWLFFLPGLWALRDRRAEAWLLILIGPVLVLLYMAYWVGAWLFGPRYYFEGFYGYMLLTVLGIQVSAQGLAWLLGKVGVPRPRAVGRVAVGVVVGVLVALNLRFYLPLRLGMMRGLYGISRQAWQPFLRPEAQRFTPALVFVESERWMAYGALLPLEDPWLTTPWVFAWSRSDILDRRVWGCFPQRTALRYDPVERRLEVWETRPLPCPEEASENQMTGQAPRRRPETSP